MRGSATQLARWPSPLELGARALLVTAIVLAAASTLERVAARPLIPVFQSLVSLLDDRFIIEDAQLTTQDGRETVRFGVNLAMPLKINGRDVYPLGWNRTRTGIIEIRYWLGGILAHSALILVVVLAWPAQRTKEMAVRLLICAPLLLLILLIEVSSTVLGEIWNTLDTLFAVKHAEAWLVWSRFFTGGGGYVLALVMAVGAVALAQRLCSESIGWRTVSRREFDGFLRSYPRPLQIDPPWEHWARLRYFTDLALGPRHTGTVARCRHSRGPTRYRVRADVWRDAS